MQPFSDLYQHNVGSITLTSGSSKTIFTTILVYAVFHTKFLTILVNILFTYILHSLLESTEKCVYFEGKDPSCLMSFLQVSPGLSDGYMVIEQKFDISFVHRCFHSGS